jgi:hypothetical protein
MSFANAVVFGDLGGAEGARLTYGCLFGLEYVTPHNPDKARTNFLTTTYIPPAVLWYMRAQKAISALLIFLFGLAVRNTLRLR